MEDLLILEEEDPLLLEDPLLPEALLELVTPMTYPAYMTWTN
jgi:hypothetical protein